MKAAKFIIPLSAIFALMLLHRFTAFLMLVILISQLFSNSLITVSFYLNQNYIAKTLCENRDKPMMHCNGKCQLQKKLAQEDNKDKQTPERRSENVTIVISSKTFFAELNPPLYITVEKKYFSAAAQSTIDYSFQFFHPPQLFM